MSHCPRQIALAFLYLLLTFVSFIAEARAMSDEERQTLEMFFDESDRVVAATRNPKPLSEIAENITVITAKEIEAINAHSLVDVLNLVPGLQVEVRGGPGASTMFSIQGTQFNHVLIMIDGVMLNNASDSAVDIGSVAVQNIDRVEIIKGPASSAWGAALGGVVNIITKSPRNQARPGGVVSASFGERMTADYRGEVSATAGRLGYYLSAGHLGSTGFTANSGGYRTGAYAKLSWALPDTGSVNFTLGYSTNTSGQGAFPLVDVMGRSDQDLLFTTLSLHREINDNLDLNVSLRGLRLGQEIIKSQLSDPANRLVIDDKTRSTGGSAGVVWRGKIQTVAAGLDFDHASGSSNTGVSYDGNFNNRLDKWGLFATDTVTLGALAVTPGIRLDSTGIYGSRVSPNLGLAYGLTERTVLRALVAKGFSLPLALPGKPAEKVLSFQVGVESNELQYLWLKSTLFRHYTWDVTALDYDTGQIRKDRLLKQGVELEMKTVPVCNTSLSAGLMLLDSVDQRTGLPLPTSPRSSLDLKLSYDDGKTFSGTLTGHRISWHSASFDGVDFTGSYSAMIWDLHLAKKVAAGIAGSAELFLSVRNIFNGAQHIFEELKNPARWTEAGLRFKF